LSSSEASSTDRSTILLFAGLAAFHALGLFSVGLLMGEGRLQCVLLGAATLLLLRAVLSAVLRARSAGARVEAADRSAGIAGCNANGGGVPVKQQAEVPRSEVDATADAGVSAAYWCSWRPVGRAVAAAAVMLACNVLLQAMGLIDRAGQDPHDKTQPSGELLVGLDAAWQHMLLLCFVVLPLVCMWLLLSWWSAWLGRVFMKSEAAAGRDQHWGSKVVGVFVRGLKLACGVQFAAVGWFWVAQLFGLIDMTAAAAAELAWVHLQHLGVKYAALGRACALLVTCFSSVVDVGTLQGVLHAAVSGLPVELLLSLPLRLLLPRVAYAIAVAAFCGAALTVCLLFSCNMLSRQIAGKPNSTWVERQSTSAKGSQLHVWLCAAFAAALVMVLGYKGPATMLLALVQAGCCCVLQRLHAAATRAADEASRPECPQQQASSSLQSVVAGGMWGMMGLQLFFCSSHFCEFSGLQYASAFIGFDSMVWYTSGSLLLLNTCGYLVLAVLSLPAFVAACTVADPMQRQAKSPEHPEHMRQQLACSMLVVNSMRFAALVVCMISAAVQQQHILLWAIFAPKLCFELWFMAVTDVGQVLASVLARVVL
jgi:phosphatidylinositol glycan class O